MELEYTDDEQLLKEILLRKIQHTKAVRMGKKD